MRKDDGAILLQGFVSCPVLTFGSLFAGIGGFDLGFERAGMKCEWQVEIDPYATRVLEKHWPAVRRWNDVRTFPPAEGDWYVDVICGGFPCQDISNAGARAGLSGERSGLWYEYARIIGELRPQFVIVENVAALLGRGMDSVLGELSSLGYDTEWHVIQASAVGALHRRERVWIVAHANGERELQPQGCVGKERGRACNCRGEMDDTDCRRYGASKKAIRARRARIEPSSWWESEPDVGRVAHGVPARVDRLRGLGNAVVPQVAEWIGRRIVELSSVS
jgi:DNA (cytosine-5)-methyltransferase 1